MLLRYRLLVPLTNPEYLIECAPGVAIDDVRAAIDRRFGPP